jgi:hypothetical protein
VQLVDLWNAVNAAVGGQAAGRGAVAGAAVAANEVVPAVRVGYVVLHQAHNALPPCAVPLAGEAPQLQADMHTQLSRYMAFDRLDAARRLTLTWYATESYIFECSCSSHACAVTYAVIASAAVESHDNRCSASASSTTQPSTHHIHRQLRCHYRLEAW